MKRYTLEHVENELWKLTPGEELFQELEDAASALIAHDDITDFVSSLWDKYCTAAPRQADIQIEMTWPNSIRLLVGLLDMRQVYQEAKKVDSKGYYGKTRL